MAGICIVLLGHELNEAIRGRLDRLIIEAPTDHHVFFMLNTKDEHSSADAEGHGIRPDYLIRSTWSQLRQLPYPGKCRGEGWSMNGNSDLLFLTSWIQKPGYDFYWFVEYDVHYEGNWGVFFEYFRSSRADLLATIINPISDVPEKLEILNPRISFPDAIPWREKDTIKAFFPICRLTQAALRAVDEDYRRGVVGHYELTVGTIAALRGLSIEDIGGRGPYVQPVNRNRFYFASISAYSYSPGSFVFRPPIRRVLPRNNTLWHPVKPAGVSAWFPLQVRGGILKTLLERLKPIVYQRVIWLWFALVWNPLRQDRQSERDRTV